MYEMEKNLFLALEKEGEISPSSETWIFFFIACLLHLGQIAHLLRRCTYYIECVGPYTRSRTSL